jgi:hypothetical protein
MHTRAERMQGKGRPSTEWEEHMQMMMMMMIMRKTGKILQEATRLAKDKKAFRIWLM